MFTKIDKMLNSITMYRLTLFILLGLSGVAMVLALFGFLPYGILPYIISFFTLCFICYGSNILFAKIFDAKATQESSVISALILFLVLFPAVTMQDFWTLILASILAMGSKYLVAIRREHLFNPAAFALVVLAALGSGNVSWWIGSSVMLPFSLIASFLILRKIRRFQMFGTFLATHLVVTAVNGIPLTQSLTSWPIVFFGAIMLTEPFTAPAGRKLKAIYAIIVGVLSAIPWHIGSFYSSPELALLIGNLFAFITSTHKRLDLKLVSKKEIADTIWEFSFLPDLPAGRQGSYFKFEAGQYLEWTLPHDKQDTRGIRRYFTIASAPSEREIKMGVKITPEASTYKKALQNMNVGDMIYAENLDGDFILPKDKTRKVAFIAGGIGVTPFRSHVQEINESNEKRDAILFYAAKTEGEVAYRDVFASIPTHYIVGEFLTEEKIKEKAPDFIERTFYISGPDVMVNAFKKILKQMGVSGRNIITDYFPGY